MTLSTATRVSLGAFAAALLVTVATGLSVHRFGPTAVWIGLAAAALVISTWLLSSAARVLWSPVAEVTVVVARQRKELEREKRALYKALRELEFDYQMGKLSSRDFEEANSRYRSRALAILKALDEVPSDGRARIEDELRARVEKQRRQNCPGCEQPNDPDAAFCKKCGRALVAR